jgi:NAD(P)-dependent dehydrogenase (short-subunit alcohol dehydrogenase family)
MNINGMAAVVTGAASGLGEATARALAERGAKVAVFDRDATRGEQVASDTGGVFCAVDVTSDEAVKAGFERARAAHGQERILVNCAGVANAAKTVGRDKETKAARLYPMQQFELAIQINLIGTFRCIANSAFGMIELEPLGPDGEKGVIINTASVAAEDGQIGQAAYSASKGGVLAMALPIARDLMNEGVRVNTILPGVFKTPMVAMMPPNVQEALGAQVPFPKRLGEAEEYARLACFLVENVYMNAAAVRLDGGIRMAPR